VAEFWIALVELTFEVLTWCVPDCLFGKRRKRR